MSAYIQTLTGSDSPPIGAVMDFAGTVEPSGWLFCWGQSLPTTGIYADLFGVIAYTYGGSGGNFNLPDFRGRVGAGRDNMGGTPANRLQSAWGVDGVTLGANGGSQSHQLTVAQLPSHTHTVTQIALPAGGAAGGTTYSNAPSNSGSTGGDGAHPNVQPTAVINKIIKYTIAAVVLPIVPGTGDVTGPNGGVADGDLAVFNGTSGKIVKAGQRGRLQRAGIYGLLCSNGADTVNDISIGVGECRSDDNTDDIYLGSPLVKQLDAAWAVGTNVGGRDTGAIADGGWHLYVIKNPSTGGVDAVFTATYGTPTMPSGYTLKRRVLSLVRHPDWSNGLFKFRQTSNYVQATATGSGTGVAMTTSQVTVYPFSGLPNGMKFLAHGNVRLYSTASAAQFVASDPDYPQGTYGDGMFSPSANINGGGQVQVWTSPGAQYGQLRFSVGATAGNNIFWATLGYWDPRQDG